MDADERRTLTTAYDRLTARVRHLDAENEPIPDWLKNALETARRRLDGLLED